MIAAGFNYLCRLYHLCFVFSAFCSTVALYGFVMFLSVIVCVWELCDGFLGCFRNIRKLQHQCNALKVVITST